MGKNPNEPFSPFTEADKPLSDNENYLRLLISYAPAALAMFDREMRYLAVSRRWKDDYSLGDRDIIGVSHYEIFADIPKAWRNVYHRSLAGEIIRADDDRFEQADGKIQWLKWEVQPWHSSDGTIGGIIISTEDITRYKQVEEEIRNISAVLERRVEERTHQLLAEIEMRRQEEHVLQQYAAIITSSDDAIISKTVEGFVTSWNTGAENVFGYTQSEVVGRPIYMLIPEQYQHAEAELLDKLRKGITVKHYETVRKRKDGELIDVSVTLSPIRDRNGNVTGVSSIARDITKRKLAEAALRKNNLLLNTTQRLSKVGGWEFDIASGRATWTEELYRIHEMQSESEMDHIAENLNCYRPEHREIVSNAFRNAVEKGVAYDLELPFTTSKGKALWVRTIGQPVFEKGKVVYVMGNLMDITERKVLELNLERQAHNDPLTGLFSRRYFMELAEREIARSRRNGATASLLMIDLDHFKMVNDTYGHDIGDAVLKQFSETCQKTFREIDIVGRLGGEEFSALLPATNANQALEVAERLRQAIDNTAVKLEDGSLVHCTVSIGLATIRTEGDELGTLLKRADVALYKAKNSGRNRVFTEDQTI